MHQPGRAGAEWRAKRRARSQRGVYRASFAVRRRNRASFRDIARRRSHRSTHAATRPASKRRLFRRPGVTRRRQVPASRAVDRCRRPIRTALNQRAPLLSRCSHPHDDGAGRTPLGTRPAFVDSTSLQPPGSAGGQQNAPTDWVNPTLRWITPNGFGSYGRGVSPTAQSPAAIDAAVPEYCRWFAPPRA